MFPAGLQEAGTLQWEASACARQGKGREETQEYARQGPGGEETHVLPRIGRPRVTLQMVLGPTALEETHSSEGPDSKAPVVEVYKGWSVS